MSEQHRQFVFGYFPRNKYKDLVFYVKTGEHSNCGLFEMPDTEENRALMEALECKERTGEAPSGYLITKERLIGLQAIHGIAQETVDEVMLRPINTAPTDDQCRICGEAIKAEATAAVIEDYTRELKERICKSNLPPHCFDRLSMIIHDTVVALRGS